MDFVIDASERLVRAELERWPDGVYHGESWMVSDGLDPSRRYRIAVKVTVAGSDITFDFSDTRRPGARLHQHAARLGDRGGADRVPDADERRRHRRADERGPLRAGDDRLPGGLAAQPALPGLVDLRQPDVRRGARVDHARARRRAARPRHGRLEPAPLHGARRRRPAHAGAVGLALDLHARRPRRDEGRRRLRRARLHRHARLDALARHGDVRALDAALHGAVRVPARLGRGGGVARRPRHGLPLALLRRSTSSA